MRKWIWKVYGALLTIIVLGNLVDIFDKDSSFHTYYTILTAFDQRYLFLAALNICSILLDLTAPLVVFLYAFDIKSSLKFWQIMFAVRIIFFLIGQPYDIQFIKASFFQNTTYGLICLGTFIIPLLPSFVAHYLYAFKKPLKISDSKEG